MEGRTFSKPNHRLETPYKIIFKCRVATLDVKLGFHIWLMSFPRMKRSAAHKPPNMPIYASKGNEHRLFSSGKIIGKWGDLHQPTGSSLQPSSCILTKLLLEAPPYDIGDATKPTGSWTLDKHDLQGPLPLCFHQKPTYADEN